MPQLDPTWFASELFWLAVTFITLYVLLARLILPPLQDVIARRAGAHTRDIEMAQSLKLQAESARVEYERTMAEARTKAQAMLTEATLASKAKAEQASRDLDQQVSTKLAEATTRIAAKKKELMDTLTPTAVQLAGMIVERLTQQRVGEDRIASVVGEVSKQRKGS